jgi:hypothetical protein
MAKKVSKSKVKKLVKKAVKKGSRKSQPVSGPDSQMTFAANAVSQVQEFQVDTNYGRRKSYRFKNSELLQSLNGSADFSAATVLQINPGLPETFPWLHREAKNWEYYRFHSFCIRYVTRSATTDRGSVIISPDYSVEDSPPNSEVSATDTQDAVEDVVWKQLCCRLDPKAMYPAGKEQRKIVRDGNVYGDKNLFDSAAVYVCTIGEADSSQIGKIWADYDVEFFVPQNSPDDHTQPQSISFFLSSVQSWAAGDPTLNLLWQSATKDALHIGDAPLGVFTPPAGYYVVTIHQVFYAASDDCAYSVRILRNGVAIGIYRYRDQVDQAEAGTTAMQFAFNANGTDTFAFELTVSTLLGTLSTVSSEGMIIWQVA